MRLEIPILRLLRAAGDCLTPEDQIRTDIRLSTAPAPTGAEISEALDQIESAGRGVSIRSQIDQRVRWQITDKGRADLAALGV